jgi:hypothetical protein
MTQQPQPPRPDPIGDFQRWLMKSSAKNLGREVRGNFRKTFGRSSEEDVWSQATREVPDEPPECEWCPICRAARKYRDSSGPGVGGHLTGAGDAFASVVSDAFSAVESALSVVRAPSAPKTPSGSPEPSGPKTPSGSPEPSGPEALARAAWPSRTAAPSGPAPAGRDGAAAEPEPAPSAGSAAAASESVAAGGRPAGAGEEPVTAGLVTEDPGIGGPVIGSPVSGSPVIGSAATAEPDAWDLATGDGQGEPADDPDHRG